MSKKPISNNELITSLSRSITRIETLLSEFSWKDGDPIIEDIAGRLRALVATGGQHMKPLLYKIASSHSKKLYIFSRNDCIFDGEEKEDLLCVLISGQTWSPIHASGYTEMQFSSWMNIKIYYSEDSSSFYSRNSLLKDYSNNMGPSHFGDKLPYVVDSLSRGFIHSPTYQLSTLTHHLVDIATAIVWIGKWLLLSIESDAACNREKSIQNKNACVMFYMRKMRALNKKYIPKTQSFFGRVEMFGEAIKPKTIPTDG